MSDLVLTARMCASNAEQFPDILKLYIPPPAKVLDMTWGNGVFWKNEGCHRCLGQPSEVTFEDHAHYVWANDLDPEKGDHHHDFQSLPLEWSQQFDAAILDPPYKLTGTKYQGDQYGNRSRGRNVVWDFYRNGIIEAKRVLRPGGILIVKCMDQVSLHKQNWVHIFVYEEALADGFRADDLFVMTKKNARWQPHKIQRHAAKNHSFFWVFANGGPPRI